MCKEVRTGGYLLHTHDLSTFDNDLPVLGIILQPLQRAPEWAENRFFFPFRFCLFLELFTATAWICQSATFLSIFFFLLSIRVILSNIFIPARRAESALLCGLRRDISVCGRHRLSKIALKKNKLRNAYGRSYGSLYLDVYLDTVRADVFFCYIILKILCNNVVFRRSARNA